MDIALVGAVEKLRTLLVAAIQNRYRQAEAKRANVHIRSTCYAGLPGNCRRNRKAV